MKEVDKNVTDAVDKIVSDLKRKISEMVDKELSPDANHNWCYGYTEAAGDCAYDVFDRFVVDVESFQNAYEYIVQRCKETKLDASTGIDFYRGRNVGYLDAKAFTEHYGKNIIERV